MGIKDVERLRKHGSGQRYNYNPRGKQTWEPTLAGDPLIDRTDNSREFVSEAAAETQLQSTKMAALQALQQPSLSHAERERLSHMALTGQQLNEPKWLTVLEKLDTLGGLVRMGIADVTGADSQRGKEIEFLDYGTLIRGDTNTLKQKLGEDLVGEEGRFSGTQLLKLAGWEDREEQTKAEQFARGTVGFAADVLLDPLSYLTFGTAGLGKKAASEAGEAAVRVATKQTLERGAVDDLLRAGADDSIEGIERAIIDSAADGYTKKFSAKVDEAVKLKAGPKADEEALAKARSEIMETVSREEFATQVLQDAANAYQDRVVGLIANGRWSTLAKEAPEWISDKTVSKLAKGGLKLTTPFGRKAVDGGFDTGIRWDGFRNAYGDRVGSRLTARSPMYASLAGKANEFKQGFGGNAKLMQELRKMGKSSAVQQMNDAIYQWNVRWGIPEAKSEANALMTRFNRIAQESGIDPTEFERTLGNLLGSTPAARSTILGQMDEATATIYTQAHDEARKLFDRLGDAYASVDDTFQMRENYFPLIATEEWTKFVDEVVGKGIRLPPADEVPEHLRNAVDLANEIIGNAQQRSAGRQVALGQFGRANSRNVGGTITMPFDGDETIGMMSPERISQLLAGEEVGDLLSTTWMNEQIREGINFILSKNGLGSMSDEFDAFSINVVKAMDAYVEAVSNAAEARLMIRSAAEAGLADSQDFAIDAQQVLRNLRQSDKGLSAARMQELEDLHKNLGEHADLILSRGGPKKKVKIAKGVEIEIEEAVLNHPAVEAALADLKDLSSMQGKALRDYTASRRSEVRTLTKLGVPEEVANDIVFSTEAARVDDAIAVIREAAGEEARQLMDMVETAAAKWEWNRQVANEAKDTAVEQARRLKADARTELNRLKKLKGTTKQALVKESVEQGSVVVPRSKQVIRSVEVKAAKTGTRHEIPDHVVLAKVTEIKNALARRWHDLAIGTDLKVGTAADDALQFDKGNRGIVGMAAGLNARERISDIEQDLFTEWRQLFDEFGVDVPDNWTWRDVLNLTAEPDLKGEGVEWFKDLVNAIEATGVKRNTAQRRANRFIGKLRERWATALDDNGIYSGVNSPAHLDGASNESRMFKSGTAIPDEFKEYIAAILRTGDDDFARVDIEDGTFVLRSGADRPAVYEEVVEDVIENETVKYTITRRVSSEGGVEGVQLQSVTNKLRKLLAKDGETITTREAWERVDEVVDQLSSRELVTVKHFNKSKTLDRYLNLSESLSEAAVRSSRGVAVKSRVESAAAVRESIQRLLDRPSRKRSVELTEVWEKERRILASALDPKEYRQLADSVATMAWTHNYDTPKAWKQLAEENAAWFAEAESSAARVRDVWENTLAQAEVAARVEGTASTKNALAMFESFKQSYVNLLFEHGSRFDPETGQSLLTSGARQHATQQFKDDVKAFQEEAKKLGKALGEVTDGYLDKELRKEAVALKKGLKQASNKDWFSDSNVALGLNEKGFLSLRDAEALGPIAASTTVHPVVKKMVMNANARLQTAWTPAGMKEVVETQRGWFKWWKASVTVGRVFDFNLNNAVGAAWNAQIAGVGMRDYKRVSVGMAAYRRAIRRGVAPQEALKEAFPDPKDYEAVMEGIFRNVVGDSFSDADVRKITDSSGSLISGGWKTANPFDVDNFIAFKGGARLMETVEDFFRMATWLRWYDGTNGQLAKSIVDATQFNYDDLSLMEEGIKKVVPFFVWTARNIPLQMRTLVERPAIANRYMKFMSNMDETFGNDPANEILGYPSYGNPTAVDLNIRLGNEEDGYTYSLLFDPRVPLLDTGAVFDVLGEPLNPSTWLEFMESNIGPQYTDLPNALFGYGGSSMVNAPRGVNEIILGLHNMGFYDGTVSQQGDAMIGRKTDKLLSTVAPIFDNTLGLAFPTDPRDQQRMGYTSPSENVLNTGTPQEIIGGIGLRTARGLGLRTNTPVEGPSKRYDAQKEIDEIMAKLKIEGEAVGR